MSGHTESKVKTRDTGKANNQLLSGALGHVDKSRRVEEAFATIFKSSLIGIYVVKDRKFRFVNPKFTQTVGYSEAELLGMDSLALVHSEDRKMVRENAVKMLKGERIDEYEYRVINKDGETRWIMEAVVPIEYLGGRAALGNFMDITERKRVEEVLKEDEERLGILFECAPDAYYLNDLKGNFIDGNKAAEQITGYSRDELIGKNFLQLKLLSAGQITKAARLLVKNVLGQSTGPDEFLLIRKDGSKVPVDIRTIPVKIKGSAVVLGIARDMTVRKQAVEVLRESEERYRDLFENANDLIQSVTPDGRFLYVNRAWRQMLGYSKEEVPALTLWDIIHPESLAHCKEVFQKVISDAALETVDAVFVTKDGKSVMVEGNVNCRYKDGKVVATRGIFRDITIRKQAEEKMRQLDRMKSEFLSNVSHELRTPLHTIKGFIKLLLAGEVPEVETEKEFLTIVDKQSEKLGEMIEGLLDMSRLESGRFSIRKQRLPVRDIIIEAIESFFGLAEERGIDVVTDIPALLPELEVDGERLRQVMVNLLGNAIKFSAEGESIAVRCEVKGVEMLVQVTDHGIGIPEEAIPHIFERFYRAKNVETRSGTGLGLYISKQIIEAHDGRIWAESSLGKGSTFIFTLPLGKSGGNSHEYK